VLAGQRIGILGANGQGKSTLVKTIAREMGALAGTVTEGKGLNIGYFAQQELDVLHAQSSPLEHMVRLARDNRQERGNEQELRNFLGTFNFGGDMVKQAVGTMSGGEKARLVLCMMVWQRPNLLLLDEPTNHLDLATREALSVALNEFEGTVMLVSHDRALLRATCDEFWLVGRGTVAPFDGDLDDYQKYLLEESKRLRQAAKEESQIAAASNQSAIDLVAACAVNTPANGSFDTESQSNTSREQRKGQAQRRAQQSELTRPLKRELEQIDARLAQLNAEKQALETRLSTPVPAAEIASMSRQLKSHSDEIATLEGRWLELSEQIEAATV
jgi:ATP-binding cassette, subfamily F, member 3